MTSSFDLLIDSDAFVGWVFPKDAHFEKVKSLFEGIEAKHIRPVTSSWVVAETATVLSLRQGQPLARTFLERLKNMHFPIIHIDERLQEATTELFLRQETRGTSMVDCANVVVMQHFSIPKLLSFDKAYSKQFGVAVLQ